MKAFNAPAMIMHLIHFSLICKIIYLTKLFTALMIRKSFNQLTLPIRNREFSYASSNPVWLMSMKFILIFIIAASYGCSSVHKTEYASSTEIDLKRKLKAAENHLYTIHLNAGEFLHIRVMQYGIDVIATVQSADKQFAEQFDSPTGELDAEDIYLLSNNSENYEIEIYPAQKYADPGDYVIKIIHLKRASESDKKWMAAFASNQKADKLRANPETRQQSIEQYKLAMAEWKALHDTLQYASAMRSLGFVYIRQKNYEEAIRIFNQLLSVWKQLSDMRSEGFTYLIIGRIYDLQKDFKTSLEYNLSSLDYWIKVKDVDQETFTLMNIGNLYAHLSDKQKAIEYFEQALKKNEQSERPSVKAVVLRDYAAAMLSVGDSQKAIALYEQSIKQWQATVNTPEEARTDVLLAAHFAENGNKQQAIHYYNHAFDIWKKMDEQNEMKTIQSALDKLEK